MALKVELKAGERFILGETVITNGNQRARLFIDGIMPILREKEIMMPEEADTPCKRIYLLVQAMYLTPDPRPQHHGYFKAINELQDAAPSTMPYLEAINNHILTGFFYKALKETRALIDYERELLDHAKRGSTSLRRDDQDNRESAGAGSRAANQGSR